MDWARFVSGRGSEWCKKKGGGVYGSKGIEEASVTREDPVICSLVRPSVGLVCLNALLLPLRALLSLSVAPHINLKSKCDPIFNKTAEWLLEVAG